MRDMQIGDIEATKPSDWAIRGVIGGLSVIWGPPGSYKTFLAIGMATCVASGRTWFGHEVKEGPVLYVLGEGGLDLFRRRAGEAARYFGVDLKTLPLWVRGEALDLGAPSKLRMLTDSWDRISPGLIVVDTLSRCLPGDENKQEVMQGFVKTLDVLRDKYQGSVLVIHHEGRSGDIRGSTVLSGAVDVNLHVTRGKTGANHTLTLEAEKLRDLDTTTFDTAKMYATTRDVRDSRGSLLLDEYGDVVRTVVVEAEGQNERVVEVMEAFHRLKRDRAKGARVGYREWYNASGAMSVSTFKRALSEIVHNPVLYGIVSPLKGQYLYSNEFDPSASPLEPVVAGDNYDVEEEAATEAAVNELWQGDEE